MNEQKLRDYLNRVTIDLQQTRQRLQESEARGREPIAIVSMSCRFAGGVRTPEDLWELLVAGRDAMTGLPTDRGWERSGLAASGAPARGAFLEDAAGFDPEFFGISPREALAMDPQQRLLLQTCWEAVERAGIDPSSLRGSRTGVFATAVDQGYATLGRGASEAVQGFLMTGNAISVLSGRVSYALGLEGPSVSVDTACSASLVAVHLAAQALRNGDCSLTLVGGANVMALPGAFLEIARQGGMAADGRCKPFSAAADGTGWGEGVGVLLLERLSDARRNGHPVLAVLRGSAVNQDGASNGLTAPNGPSQQRVIKAALTDAALTPTDIDAVEAHGTGTRLGDPIEADALIATYGQNRSEGQPLLIGSMKSNLGHTQAAAGVAGVIKTVLALQHGVLPGTLHVDAPTPHVDWSAGSVELLTEARAWPRTGRPRRAAVSSFGMSGTNAHVVLEQAVEPEPESASESTPAPVPWVLSARSREALRDQAARLAAQLAAHPDLRPADVGFSLVTARSAFEHRAVLVGTEPAELLRGLAAVAQQTGAPGPVTGQVAIDLCRTVFVFPGQGSQWLGMARDLLRESAVFADAMADCERALTPHLDWSPAEVLRDTPGAPSLDRIDVVQPVLFAVMVSLAALWQSYGVRPDAVVGHSQGEVAAAVVAGALTLEDGARVVALRSRAQLTLSGTGAMASVALSAAAARQRLARWPGRLSVAAVNGPESVVVSGDPAAVAELLAACGTEGVGARPVSADVAGHSGHMDVLKEGLVEALAGIRPRTSEVPFHSTVTGGLLDTVALDAGYWFRNMRETVDFDAAVRSLLARDHRVFLEISPHPVLAVPVQGVLDDLGQQDCLVAGTLRREDGGLRRMLASLAEAYVHGVPVDWSPAFAEHRPRLVDLPSYAFQNRRFWLQPTGPAVAGGDPADASFWAAVEREDAEAVAATVGTSPTAWSELLPPLADWRRRRQVRAVLDRWRYRVGWQLLTDRQDSAPLTGSWLLLTPSGAGRSAAAPAAALGAVLAERGAEVVELALDAEDSDPAALAGRLRAALDGRPPLGGLLSLLALDEHPSPGLPALPSGLALNSTLVRSLADLGATAPLWCATSGAVPVTGQDPVRNPLQAQTWGLGRVVALEQPALWGGLVDLPDEPDPETLRRLADLLAGDGAEDQVALRPTGAYGRRLVRAAQGPPRPSWRPTGTVLVTGGTGGLGTHTARWLAAGGAEHLVLLSRHGADAPGAAELAAELTASGTRVTLAAGDITDRAALGALVDRLAADGDAVRAVVHTAAAVQLGPASDTGPAELAATLEAKALGAANLDAVFQEADLDAFVLFSSVSGVWGSADHGAYAAGNAYLDALADHRRGRGLKATSVVWGIWSAAGGGLATGELEQQLLERGIPFMDPSLAVAGLQRVLDDDETVVVVADVDWARFVPVFTSVRPSPLISHLPEVTALATAADESGQAGTDAGAELRAALRGQSAAEVDRTLVDLVRRHAAAVLGHDSVDAVRPDRAFRELGFDSLIAVELRNRLNAATGLRLRATVVFDHPTAGALAEALRIELTDARGSASAEAVLGSVTDPHEPIAVVAMSCRLPGGIDHPDKLWQLLSDGGDVVSGMPSDRGWPLADLYHPDPDRPGRSYVREGGFLHDAGDFDPGFFGISPREAVAMDPQQRLMLETSWEAVERAGIDPAALRESRTGVFVGVNYQDYTSIAAGGAPSAAEGHLVAGGAASVVSGRVAYALGLEGPAVTVDTACSSSLVALHLAAQSLRGGDCTLALAGGVAVMATPGVFIGFSRQRGLAADGRCKAFGAAADGMGLAEGAGVLLLERLSDARRNGHPVLAVLRGSAINQDGASNGLSAPNGQAQQRVIRQALANAGLTPDQVDAVEAHGTGTTLGDPIEADALLATYGRERGNGEPLWLGAVKSNLGHTQAASGVVGVIKTVLALRHGVLPRTLHVDRPTPHVDWASGAVELLTEAREWPRTGRPRRAGVSAFGFSGTNAHAVLEQAEEPLPEDAAERRAAPVPVQAELPWLLSAKTAPALAAQAGRLAERLRTSRVAPVDVAFSLATGRGAFEHRAVLLGGDRAAQLAALAAGDAPPEALTGSADAAGRRVFVFPGQGAQWAGMAVPLLDAEPVFAAAMADCERALAPHTDWSLTGVLRSGEPLERVDVVQPALFAVMVSLAALWRSWGVHPDAVIGHSQGEIAAAVVAGALTLQDGATVVAQRSHALRRLTGHGGMLSLSAPQQQVRELITPWEGQLSVAAVNGPSAVVVSGGTAALAELLAQCERQGVRARTVPVDYASHSAQVEQIRPELAGLLAGIAPVAGQVPLFSTVTGDWLNTGRMDADYWYRNLRQTVLLETAVRSLAEQDYQVFLEVSPHPVLTVAVQDCAEAAGRDGVLTAGTLRRDDGGPGRARASAAELWVRGVPVDWPAVLAGSGGRTVELPTYPFEHQRFWLEPSEAATEGVDQALWDLVADPDLDGTARSLAVDAESLGRVLPALTAWREQRRESAALESWRYRIQWQPVPRPDAGAPGGRWLLVLPPGHGRDGRAAAVAGALAGSGAELRTVELTDGHTDRAALAERLAEALDGPVDGVLSLLALDERPHPRYPGLPTGAALTLALVQTLGDLAVAAPLWCATSGAVSVGAGDPLTAPGQALVWGTGMVAGLEHSARWGGLVDLPPVLDARALAALCAVLAGATGEDQLAVRPAGLLARRLVRAPRPSSPRRSWRPRGTVLVTGGTGALGPHIARWLARGGAEHLVLPGRRGALVPGAAELTAELAALGTRLSLPVCDLADRAAVAELLAGLEERGEPVTAVLHAAAYIELAPLDRTPMDSFERVVAAKAAGAGHLDQLLDRELDAFVMFSSIAGVWGSSNHAAYSAGNAYLDALAGHRRSRGLSATTVDWGVWKAANPWAARETVEDADFYRVQRQGLPLIDPEPAVTALQQALDDDETVIALAEVDWEQFAAVFTSVRPSRLLTGVPEVRALLAGSAAGPAAGSPASSVLHGRLVGRPAGEQVRTVLELVRAQAAAVLGHDSAEAVPAGRAFQELGFDSLTAVELRNRLNTATGLRLPATLVFDYPSAGALAEHIRSSVLGERSTRSGGPSCERSEPDEPVAIVAMGCRLPGGVSTPEQLWQLLVDRGDAVTEFPTGRGWDLAGLYDPDPDRPGTCTTRHGGFLHDAAEFDAEFFGIPPREAVAMDPQQRLLLETSWETLERAGIDPVALRGSHTGVFTGVNYQDYAAAVAQSAENEGYALTGSAASVVSGRVAYTLGLEGPAITVDTACSASLVALHLAARALRAGDCSLALVGGVAVMSTPGALVGFSRQHGLAADGRCKAFADTADGLGMAEGAAVLLVERLSDARRNGHPVLAVLRGSAINQDGASNGLAAPNGPSQQRVIRAALADAGLAPDQVDAVEAHGTGTRLGDPIEAQALLATYGQDRPADRPLLIGSLKSNIGHTQAAAGVAGVMKTVLALQHRMLPATLHVDRPSDQVDWTAGAVELLTEAREWPEYGRPRRAGVSSFGMSGTNAHVVLEQAPEEAPAEAPHPGAAGPLPWLLSARTPAALAEQAERLSHSTADAADVAVTLARRTAFEYRSVLVGAPDQLPSALADGSPHAVHGRAGTDRRVVFVFPGQGAQWAGMAAELLDTDPVFAARMADCEQALAPYLPTPLTELLRSHAPLDRAEVVQPALFAVMVSLAAVWQSYGIVPDAVLGHSQGEIAAAVVAGALTLHDGATVVALRSQALRALTGHGAMASIALPQAEAAALLTDGISIAAVNGPSTVVVSGPTQALTELLTRCRHQGVRAHRIDVDYASHSAQVEEIKERLATDLAPITANHGTIPLLSTLTGDWLDGTLMNAGYWYRNLREQVRFEQALRALAAAGFDAFVEVSPHPVLTMAVEETVADAAVLGTLRRDEGGPRRMLLSAGQAWTAGLPVDWSRSLAGGRFTQLPTYAFQRRPYWAMPAPTASGDVTAAGLGRADHPLLGAAVELADSGELLLSGRLSLGSHPWLADHAVAGKVLLPGAAFVELAVRAADEVGCPVVEELTLQAPLVLPDTGAVQVQLRVAATDGAGRRVLDLHSRPAGSEEPWTRHASGVLAPEDPAAPEHSPAPEEGPLQWPPAGSEPVPVDGLYERLDSAGYGYGPAFQGLTAAWSRGDEVFAEVRLPREQAAEAAAFGLHPALLDAALHGLWLMPGNADPRNEEPGTARLPFSWGGVRLHASGATVLRVTLGYDAGGAVSIRATDPAGQPVASVEALSIRPVAVDALRGPGPDTLFRLEWVPLPGGSPGREAPEAVLLRCGSAGADPAAVRVELAEALRRLQDWLADDGAGRRLVFVTTGAVAVDPGEGVPDLAGAAVRGLVRSAQAEHPDRFLLVDTDDPAGLPALLPRLLAAGEPQLAVRAGRLLAGRLVRVPATGQSAPVRPAEGGTVLVTGAGGVLGSLTARHLVRAHGVRSLLLAGRRGPADPAALALAEELRGLGAEVQLAACDLADRAAVARLLAAVPAERPLTAVVHTAGVLDDGIIESLTPERLDPVLRPKVDAAHHLHELTSGLALTAFVLFSSASGTVGSAGQGSYAAANSFLDALAQQRRSQGLPGQSLAWGLWEQRSALTETLGATDLRRMQRGGIEALSSEEGLALFDAALGLPDGLLLPVKLDLRRMWSTAGPAGVPALFRGLVRGGPRRAAAGADAVEARALPRRLAGLGAEDRVAQLVDLVRVRVAEVLGHEGAAAVDPDRAFKDLGFDSLASVELRNRLNALTGLRLPATLVFDCPSPVAVARYLSERLLPSDTPSGSPSGTAAPAPDGDPEIRRLVAGIPLARLKQAGLLETLLALAAPHATAPQEAAGIESMDAHELVRMALGDLDA
ncbi:type I polyketide synthase [Streptacidiphilus sp. EB129]|uniref:type I polyketide synthase n=1 Tax=Streptacidiphilus sp. EB129 TaxID=3156262 RepID=UPI003518948D